MFPLKMLARRKGKRLRLQNNFLVMPAQAGIHNFLSAVYHIARFSNSTRKLVEKICVWYDKQQIININSCFIRAYALICQKL